MKELLINILKYELQPLQLCETIIIVSLMLILMSAEVFPNQWHFWVIVFSQVVFKWVARRQLRKEMRGKSEY